VLHGHQRVIRFLGQLQHCASSAELATARLLEIRPFLS
jgi:hypothetical protein